MQPISPRTYKVIFLIIFLAIGFGVFAQAPNLLNYQGVARNAVGNPLPNQAMNLRLSVHNLSASGMVVYSETRPITTNLGGLFSVQIGSAGTTSSTGTLGSVNWLSGDKYLQVEIDPASNNNYLNLGTVQLVSVPYAFNAATAGNATTANKLAAPKNINGVAFDGSADISIAAAASAELLTGTNIKSTVTGSSLTSVGTLTNLTVTNPIAGSITGNAATASLASTVTTNANLSGDVTSVGNATTVKQINGTALSGLATGILKNTTTTGVPSIAVAGTDYLTPTGSAAGLTNFPTFNQKTTGNAATATKLETPKNINGVAFDGTGDITVTADAGTLTGNTLKSTVTGSSLTSVGTLTNLTVTNPIVGSVTGNAATASNLTGLTTPVATLNNLSGVNTGDQTNIFGNAATATKLAPARSINGVSFDGTGDISVAAAAEQLTGTTLKSTVTGSSLTSVGTLANLTVTNPIVGSITGNAATATTATTVTTNANLTGDVTSVGNATTIADNEVTTAKIATSAVATASIADGAITNAKVTDVAATKITGTLPVANGGTGLSTTPSNGQLDIGNGTGFTRATLTAGTGISITNTSGAVTIASTAVPSGATAGDMLYWNGTVWVTIPTASSSGQVLYSINNGPQWGPIVGPTDVINPRTGKIWMDHNLGAIQVATSATDPLGYGDLYQWGRRADGHQLRTSGTTSTLSSTDNPGHLAFILVQGSPFDWRSTQSDNLWQGVNGINNPCPSSYRLPTNAELNAERTTWISNNAAGAFASPLKLPMAGFRKRDNGSVYDAGSYGYYWSSTVNSTNLYGVDALVSGILTFRNSTAEMENQQLRANGFSVRCIKD